jgi:hypothetical protein
MTAIPGVVTPKLPSGTATPSAENENIACVLTPELCVVKLSLPVGSNPLPPTIPVPSITRADAFCIAIVDERRSKVKPPTVLRSGVGVDGLNIQGAAIVTGVFTGIPAKSPVLRASTCELIQLTTLFAVNKEFVSNVDEPAKLMFPFIGVA